MRTLTTIALLTLACAQPAESAPAPKAAKSPDANALGFRAYQDGDLPRAKSLFEQAVREQPENPYAWFNLGRVTFLLGENTTVEDECNLAENPVYRALHSFTRAYEVDAAKTLAKLGEAGNRLDAFKQRDEVKKWLASLEPLPTDATSLAVWMKRHPRWHVARGARPAAYTFETGGAVQEWTPPDTTKQIATWRIEKDELVLTLDGVIIARLRPVRQRFAFGEGAYAFQRVVLAPSTRECAMGDLILDPVLGDCEGGYL